MPEIHEHSASNGEATSGMLKAFGIVALVAGIFLALVTMSASNEAARPYAMLAACLFFGQGLVICVLFIGFGIMLDNVVAIRKNSQHLAAIRHQTISYSPVASYPNAASSAQTWPEQFPAQ